MASYEPLRVDLEGLRLKPGKPSEIVSAKAKTPDAAHLECVPISSSQGLYLPGSHQLIALN